MYQRAEPTQRAHTCTLTSHSNQMFRSRLLLFASCFLRMLSTCVHRTAIAIVVIIDRKAFSRSRSTRT